QEEHRRDQGAAVGNSDPEDEVDDERGPHHRAVPAAHPEAVHDDVAERHQRDAQHRQVEQEDRPPYPSRPADQLEDVVVELLLRLARRDVLGDAHVLGGQELHRVPAHDCPPPTRSIFFKYVTPGLVLSSLRAQYRRSPCDTFETSLSGSSRSPNTIAWVGHDCWHAV